MYSNAQYYRDITGAVSMIRVDIDGVTSFVPIDPENTDYANLMELEREGKIVIQPADGTEQ
jgi:hypothetical protein